jgi:ketosteroid isomerase-like protein
MKNEEPAGTGDGDQDALAQLRAEAAIRRCLARYCRGVDRGDVALIRDAYWPDAVDDHGVFKGSGHDFAAFVVEALARHSLGTQHAIAQSSFEIEGDSAFVETYVLARHTVRRDGKLLLETFGGRYVDRFACRGGEWRIARRQVVHDWSRVEPIVEEFPHENFAIGKRGHDDPSYRSD